MKERKTMKENKISIPLGDGFTLVAEANPDTEHYREMYVYLVNKEGQIWQDLVNISEEYEYDDDGNTLPRHGEYSVKVYTDTYNEDWQVDHHIERWEEE